MKTIPWGLLALLTILGAAATGAVAAPREVNVHFRGRVERGVPLDFGPVAPALRVKVGERRTLMYRFTNLSNRPLVLEAVRQVEPAAAEAAVSKLHCLSLQPQRLEAHESKLIPIAFRLEATLPSSVAELTLGYRVVRSRAPHE